jgi:hypothetical protein
MIEVMIERWSQGDGSVDWLWSVWQDGTRRHMGGAHPSADSAGMEARAFCRQNFGQDPDRVTVL